MIKVNAKMTSAEVATRRERICELWMLGMSLDGIAADLGTTPGSISNTMGRMRLMGWDLPYRKKIQVPLSIAMNVEPAFGNWLAGFIDGEGSFGIYPSGRGMAPRFTLALRDDDAAILSEIVERTGIGRLKSRRRFPSSHPGSKSQKSWLIYDGIEQLKLIAILDAHPLRAKKARDYAIWREAVLVKTSSVAYGMKKVRLAALARELAQLRAYA